jgi:hypothetical protein
VADRVGVQPPTVRPREDQIAVAIHGAAE